VLGLTRNQQLVVIFGLTRNRQLVVIFVVGFLLVGAGGVGSSAVDQSYDPLLTMVGSITVLYAVTTAVRDRLRSVWQ